MTMPARSGANDDGSGSQETRPDALHLAALFVNDWSHEFDSLSRGEVPSHRVFGVADLIKAGHAVTYLRRPRSRRWLPASVDWRIAQAWWVMTHQRQLDAVIATHEAAALPSLVLRRLRLLRRPLLVMTVAATDTSDPAGFRFAADLKRWALRGADALTVFARSQIEPLTALLDVPASRISFLPLGVDIEFFSPRDTIRGPDVLAVGTNAGKDYPTLVRALPDGLHCTIITDDENRRAAEPHVGEKDVTFLSNVPITRLRQLYAEARVVVIPLRPVAFSSGQTVLLENLALDTPCIITAVDGIKDYVDNEVVRLVPPGDVAALNVALQEAGSSGGTSRAHVLQGFTTKHMAFRLESILREMLSP